ncbi:MAG: hypothetical protein IH941_00460 [Acidobacteria bacterium]|nr:hypothetical protein [Acidobacteriota bacterium]
MKLLFDPVHLADIEANHSCNERFNGDWDAHRMLAGLGENQNQRGSQ